MITTIFTCSCLVLNKGSSGHYSLHCCLGSTEFQVGHWWHLSPVSTLNLYNTLQHCAWSDHLYVYTRSVWELSKEQVIGRDSSLLSESFMRSGVQWKTLATCRKTHGWFVMYPCVVDSSRQALLTPAASFQQMINMRFNLVETHKHLLKEVV